MARVSSSVRLREKKDRLLVVGMGGDKSKLLLASSDSGFISTLVSSSSSCRILMVKEGILLNRSMGGLGLVVPTALVYERSNKVLENPDF